MLSLLALCLIGLSASMDGLYRTTQLYISHTATLFNPTSYRPVQAHTYIKSQKGRVPADALYIVYIGANDYLTTISGHNNATVEAVLDYTGRAMDVLYKAGARV